MSDEDCESNVSKPGLTSVDVELVREGEKIVDRGRGAQRADAAQRRRAGSRLTTLQDERLYSSWWCNR